MSETGVSFSKSYYVRRYGFLEEDLEISDLGSRNADLKDKAEFAEDKPKSEIKNPPSPFTPEQQAIEDLADTVIPAAADGLKGNEELFVKIIEESESYEEAMERLLETWPDLDMDELAGNLETALLNADLFGRWSVDNEND